MYLILDRNLKRIGQLTLDNAPGSCPFWGDEINQQLADEDSDLTADDLGSESVSEFNAVDPHANTKNWLHTLNSINVPYGYPETEMIKLGNCLAYQDPDSDRWYVMRLTDVTDNTDVSGTHYVSAVGVNLAVWDLGHTTVPSKTLYHATAADAFGVVMADSGWIIGDMADTGNPLDTLEFDGKSNAQSMLQTLCQTYDVEIDAYILFNSDGSIGEKRIDVVSQLGGSDYKRVLFGVNATEITRTASDANLFTRLYVYGPNNENISSVNDGKLYVQDEEANDLYNSHLPGEPNTYLEGAVTSSTISNPAGLKSWAERVLDYFNHPKFNYTINANLKSNLGDEVMVEDLTMSPELTVTARVIQKKISQADPTQDQYVLGEFVSFNALMSSLVDRLKDLADQIGAVKEAQDDASAITLNLLTPDGDNFSRRNQSKRLILQAMVGKVNITNFLDYKGFEWQRINDDGTIDTEWKTPTITNDFRIIRQHENAKIGENHATKLLQFGRYTDFEGALSTAVQYFVPLSDGSYIVNTNRLDAEDDTAFFWLDSNLKIKNSMIVTHGGHGSSFGAQLINGVPHIWTLLRKSTTEGDSSWVGEVTWQANKRVAYDSKGVNRYCQHSRFMRIGLDEKNNYLLIGYSGGKGTIYICDFDDVKNDVFAPLYSVQQADYGIDTALTFQSQSLDFPYLALDYGDYAMKEAHRKVYIINVETNEMVTEHWYTFSPSGMGDFNATKEPEGIILSHDDSGYYLLQGFNTKDDTFQPVFKMPVTIQGTGKRVEANLNGSLLNLTDDFSGKIRATVESDYLLDDPEVTIDENAAEHIADYKHPDPVKFPDGDYAAQYCVQLEDGSYMTSHHYQGSLADSHKNDTMYIHWDSSFKYLDQMLVQWGGHGSSFGVDMVNGNPWIWSAVIDYDTKKRYIAHFAYRAGTQEKWTNFTNKQLERYCEFTDALRVNYDPLTKLVGVSRQNGDYEVLDVSDVTNNSGKPLYKINIHDYGFDSSKQTYQSQVLDFPYLYWQSGAYDMHDERIMYCVNVVTGALEFTHVYEFKTITPLMAHREPEGISLIKGTDSDKLLVSFNFNDDTNANHTESFWAIPIKYRDPVPEITNDIGEGDGTQ